jgi:hypothetical protein
MQMTVPISHQSGEKGIITELKRHRFSARVMSRDGG